MTDLEMDLMIAKAELEATKRTIDEILGKKCGAGSKISIGAHELDPCFYKTTEIHKNVTVEVRKCTRCGHVDIVWYRQDGGCI